MCQNHVHAVKAMMSELYAMATGMLNAGIVSLSGQPALLQLKLCANGMRFLTSRKKSAIGGAANIISQAKEGYMPNQINEAVAGFMEEDAYLREDVPKPSVVPVVSPMSVTLGVSDDVLENTVFTKVKMQPTDFRATPRKLPRLIFINKEKLLQNPALVGQLSPLVLALTPKGKGPFFTLGYDETDKQLSAIMRDSYLLLPLYASSSRGLQPWGTDIVFRDRFYPSPGKLRMKAVGCDHLYLFGKKYQLDESKYGVVNFWHHRSHWSLKEFMDERLMNHDVDENLEALPEASC